MSVSAIASCFRMANISSCLRMVLAFSTPFSSAKETSSAGVFDLRSWSLISRIGVVLWSNFQEEGGARWLQEKRARKKRPASSKQGKRRMASNLMRRPVMDRNATTSACVGWDKHNIESRLAFRKQPQRRTGVRAYPSERLDDHHYHDADHQNGRHLIDNSKE